MTFKKTINYAVYNMHSLMKDMIPETEQSATKIFIMGTSACHPIDLFCPPKYFIFQRFLKLLKNLQKLKQIDTC
jgi:hypothetical protein